MYTHIITPSQFKQLTETHTPSSKPYVVFDCRHDLTQASWSRVQYDAAHIAGAHFAALDDDLSGAKIATATSNNGRHPLPDRQIFVHWLAEHGVTQQTQIVCYDQQDGMFAARLWWMCRWAGFVHVAVLEGGYAAWLAGNGLLAQHTPSKPVVDKTSLTELLSLAPLEQVLTTQNVLDNLLSPKFAIIDARAPERYRGEVEPLDAVAGHIPNAINHVFKLNIDAQGQFISDLAARWHTVSDSAQGLPLAHQCGSGVTACHNILALHVAGLLHPHEASKLYAGSWSEWCSDPTRPVAKA